MLTGTLYSYMADSFVGAAGLENATGNTRTRAMHMSRAEIYIDKARECKYPPNLGFRYVANWIREGYKRAEDIEGECEQLMKKAIFAKLRGDEKLAEEWAQNHNKVWEEGQARITDV